MRARLPTRYESSVYAARIPLSEPLVHPILGLGTDSFHQAIGVIPGKEGGVTFLVKKSDKHHQPATSTQTTTFGPQRSTRKYVFSNEQL
jgi:hypothetical protein